MPRPIAILLLLVLLVGCGQVRPTVGSGSLCGENQRPSVQEKLLLEQVRGFLQNRSGSEALAEADRAMPDCVYIAPIGQAEGILFYVGLSEASVFAWVDPNGLWSMAVLRPAGKERMGFPFTGSLMRRSGKPELLIAETGGGSGGFGTIFHAAMGEDGILRARPVSPLFAKFDPDFLEPNLVLVTHTRGFELPAAWTCNACQPVNDQVLLRWEPSEGRFVELGRRRFSDPQDTVNRFLGALQEGDRKRAMGLAVDHSVVDEAAKRLGLPQEGLVRWQSPEMYGETQRLFWLLEKRNWALLPRRYRTQIPKEHQQLDFPLALGEETVMLKLVRTERGWLVARVGK